MLKPLQSFKLVELLLDLVIKQYTQSLKNTFTYLHDFLIQVL